MPVQEVGCSVRRRILHLIYLAVLMVGAVTIKRGPHDLFWQSSVVNYGIDVTGLDNPCAVLQAAVDEFNTNSRYVTISVRGQGDIVWSDLTDRGNYRTCVRVGNPAVDKTLGGSGYVTMHWDSVNLDWTATGQTEPAILFQAGTLYNSTTAAIGYVSDSFKADGKLRIKSTVAVEGSWPDGSIPQTPWHTNSNSTTTVGFFFTGFIYNDLADWDIQFQGPSGRDADDIGFYIQSGFGGSWGHMTSQNNGTGLVIEGGMSSTKVENVLMSQNNVGVVIGQRYTPTAFVIDNGTSKSENVSGLALSGVTQGNSYGQLVVFYTSNTELTRLYVEEGTTQNRHSVYLCPGACSTTTDNLCAVNADCPGVETCNAISGTNIVNLWVTGSHTGLQTDSIANDDGTVLGPTFTRNATSWLPSLIIDKIQATSSNPLIRTYSPSADGIIVSRDQTRIRDWGYPYVASPRFRYDMTTSAENLNNAKWNLVHTVTNAANAANRTITLTSIDEAQQPVRFCDTGGAGELIIDPDTGTTRSIVFPGLAPAAGATITSDTSTTPSCVTLFPISSTQWLATNISGTWTTP